MAPPQPEPEIAERPQYATPDTDPNLAELTARLEAALRRPTAEPAADLPVSEASLEPVAMEPAPAGAAAAAARAEVPEVRPDRPALRPSQAKNFYESLEQEMASLLGRPPGKT